MSDDYEAKYMQGAGTLLHREKTVWKLHWILLFGPILVFLLTGLGLAGVIQDHGHPMSLGAVAFLLPLGLLMLALWAMFISLRIHVTTREVHVQFGLFGPKIPIEAIDSVVVRDYPALALGGGIKWYDGAWAYTLWGQGTRFVRIEWHDPDPSGKKNSTIVWAQDPDKLAAIIQEARTGKKVRVEEFEGAPAEVEEEQSEEKKLRS